MRVCRLIVDLTELSLPSTMKTYFPNPDDLLNFTLTIEPDEGSSDSPSSHQSPLPYVTFLLSFLPFYFVSSDILFLRCVLWVRLICQDCIKEDLSISHLLLRMNIPINRRKSAALRRYRFFGFGDVLT